MVASVVRAPASFTPGFQLVDGSQLNSALNSDSTSVQDGVIATASGTQANAYALLAEATRIATVATTADSVSLPFAQAGMQRIIRNNGANSTTVYSPVGNNPATGTTDTINGTAGATGVAVAAAATAWFICYTNGAWNGPVGLT